MAAAALVRSMRRAPMVARPVGALASWSPLAGVPTPSWAAAHPVQVRFVSRKAGVRRSVKKQRAKATWARIRGALKFAERFDPRRTTELSLKRTLVQMGWPHTENEVVAEGLAVRFALDHRYVAIEVFMPEEFVPGTMILLPESQARVDAITAAGWKCIVVSQRAWERHSNMAHGASFGKRDLLVKLVVDKAPYEARGPGPKEIGLDATRAAKGTIHSKKRMKGKNP